MSITVVAKRAGVSSSTVSRVINNHPRVAPETVRTVRRVMAELGYVPSDRRPGPKPHARTNPPAQNVAFLKFSFQKATTPGFEELLRGVSEAARKHNITLSLYDLPHADDIPRKILEHPIHGVLLHGARPSLEVRRAMGNIPTVWLMGNRVRPEWGDQVMPDANEIGHMAATYLLNRGHKHLAFLNLDRGHWPFRHYCQAFHATAEEAHAHAIQLYPPTISPNDTRAHFEPESLSALADAFVALDPRPTGVFIADDFQAALIQPSLIQRGVRFGGGGSGVEVISCNKEDPYLMGLSPRPATIDIRVESIGRKGFEHLLWRAAHQDFPDRIVTCIEPRLIGADGKPVPLVQEPV